MLMSLGRKSTGRRSQRAVSPGRPPGTGPALPSRSTSTARIPTASAPATSCSIESPACTASSGRPRRRARARARNIAPPGFASPTSADVSTSSTRSRSPVSSSTPCSETSQLLTTTSRAPAARSSRRTSGRPPGTGRKRSARSSAASSSSRGRAREPPSASRSTSVHAVAQPREAVGVGGDVVVLAVVGHLGLAARAPRPLARGSDSSSARRPYGSSSSTSVPSASRVTSAGIGAAMPMPAKRHRHATQCQVAKIPEYTASPIALSASSTGPRRRPSSAHAATAMKSGNSTSRKRGSDMSGWGSTG